MRAARLQADVAAENAKSLSLTGAYIDSFDVLLKAAMRNNISKALLYMQHAVAQKTHGGVKTLSQQQCLEVSALCAVRVEDLLRLAVHVHVHVHSFVSDPQTALSLIRKAEEEERAWYSINKQTKYTPENPKVGRVPPPPILLCRTDGYMTFKPAPFKAESGEKVCE